MQQYRSFKVVSAMLITAIDPSVAGARLLNNDEAVSVDGAYMDKHEPQPGGYYVRYADGYESFSPAAAFESGYVVLAPNATPDASVTPRELHGHKVNPANDVLTITVDDAPGSGGAQHRYAISGFSSACNPSCPQVPVQPWVVGGPTRAAVLDPVVILFQNGPIPKAGVNGVTHEALLAVLIDRLESFQNGPYACIENGVALNHLLEAQGVLHARTQGRMARGVEGTHTV